MVGTRFLIKCMFGVMHLSRERQEVIVLPREGQEVIILPWAF